MDYIKLYNGVQMPTLGYGVFLVSPDECERCVSDQCLAQKWTEARGYVPRYEGLDFEQR